MREADNTYAALSARGLRKAFGAKVAVDHVDLDVAPGSFFGIVGPNGAGKTTTLRMATGLLRPDAGQVAVGGIDVWADPVAAKTLIGVLPEDLALFERLTGRELLAFHGALRNIDARVVTGRAEELLDLLGLTDAADSLVVDYSHGMRKKLVLAAALLHDPQLLFLDEPFEAIDPVSARSIRQLLSHFTETGSTIVFSSHVMELVERLCDHVAVMARGRIVWSGPLDELRAGRTLEDAFVALVGENDGQQELSWLGNSRGLKLRLIRNGFRAPQYLILFLVGASGAGLLAFIGFATLAGLRDNDIAANVTLVTFAAVTVSWTVVPLMGFGTDETLDPQRLALLPLTHRQLLSGLLVAALVGIAPIATGAALAGAIIGLAHSLVGALLIAIAVVATLLLCVVASRVLIALLAPLLRSRRGRDLMVMAITLAVFVPQAFRFFHPDNPHNDAARTFADIASRVRYSPFGWTGWAATEASKGHSLAAAAILGAVAALIAVLLWIWSIAIPRAMTASDISAVASAESRKGRRASALFPRFVPLRRRGRVAAIAAKELRYYVRDPRRRAPLFSALVIPALVLVQTLRDGASRPGAATLLGLIALLPASGLTLNQFGLDGAALWSTIVAGNNPRADLIGKNIATGIVLAPLVIVPTLLTAYLTHGWAYVPLTLGLAPGALGVVLAIGDLVSVYVPYALPDRRNPLAANPGQGCVGGIAALAALATDALILVPVGLLTAFALTNFDLPLATVLCVFVATAYGGTAWIIGRDAAARRAWWRMPELLDAVSPRHAG